EIHVRRRLRMGVVIGDDDELVRVWREVVLQRTAELERRGVELARREIARRAVIDIHDERVRRLSVAPRRPVAIEKRVGHVRLQLPFLPAIGDTLVAGVVAVALGIDVAVERDPFPVRRPERIGSTAGDRRQLSRFAALERKKPDVVIAQKRDGASVGREHGVLVGIAARQLMHVRAASVADPDARRTLRLRKIARRDGEDEARAVAPDVELTGHTHAIEVFDREGALLRDERQRDKNENEQERVLSVHSVNCVIPSRKDGEESPSQERRPSHMRWGSFAVLRRLGMTRYDRLMPQLEGKTGIIFGVANKRSIAWAIAQALSREGMRLAFTYQGERLKANVEELCAAMPDSLILPCDVTIDAEIDAVFREVGDKFGGLNALVHSVAFA